MNKNTAKLISWLVRYGVTATEYKAHLDKKHVKPKGEPFKTALAAAIAIETP